ncbi:MAG TPA: LytTR family DNA-binding domain-containing protein [Steroidobacteraceae bacterium]|nr:LytTR family DNA-binding domain-containing protein [Steroidobacteraceae bacterium]
MSRPTAIIAEDEPLLRAEIRETLRTLWPELVIGAEAADGLEAIQAVERLSPDIVFLDIQMPGATGLDVAAYVSGKAHVVFISAFDQHALAAFERGAFDYILKPLSMARLELTVNRLRERLRLPPAELQDLLALLREAGAGEHKYVKWLSVPQGTDLRIVTVAEVCYLRSDQKYTALATRSATYLLNSSLKEMREKLDPAMFWQIHRGIIVNVGAIDTIYRTFRGTLEVKLKERTEVLPVSTAHAHLFRPA